LLDNSIEGQPGCLIDRDNMSDRTPADFFSTHVAAPDHPAVVRLEKMRDEEGMHPYDIGRDLVEEMYEAGDPGAVWLAIVALLRSPRFLTYEEDEDSDYSRSVAWACTHYLLLEGS
jgi:hypothetical protein